jgi:hypothetical protein
LEDGRFIGSQFGKHFAVDFDLILFEKVHKSAVRRSFIDLRQPSIDALNPETAKIAFAVFPAFKSILTGMHQFFVGGLVMAASGEPVPFDGVQDFFMAGMGGGTGFDTHINLNYEL